MKHMDRITSKPSKTSALRYCSTQPFLSSSLKFLDSRYPHRIASVRYLNPDIYTSESVGANTCAECSGKGHVLCPACSGSGCLQRGGYNKRITLRLNRILGSKWTAMQETMGWRHFRVVQQCRLQPNAESSKNKNSSQSKPTVFLLMQASCDNNAQLWVNADVLRDRQRWAAGWLLMSEMADPDRTLAGSGALCRVCTASGICTCPQCGASGVALIDL
ncbi:hypothetical protein CEUSTIGMA_g5223.t1 [Chlamydomonas eustigma]|uniref:Uncharacterized protein n=1 Tax=Chlamydomonas eustigma TaxID=1157962 RepID=A0A250X4T8_9CHLO|nr:hypothetical protein CEUSTIGMA_g5223.t1 [Chlamydomonas eustigma]|eukprot:GAX77780.1 hypothetical protein CEUSTIGMA_g5223.t1 [Chlamydomonas eustigma]